jgi:hypothetical protein
MIKTSTYFALLAEFGTAEMPLERVAEKFWGLGELKARQKAVMKTLPVPAYRGAPSERAPWFINAADLAKYLDDAREEAALEWRKTNGKSPE